MGAQALRRAERGPTARPPRPPAPSRTTRITFNPALLDYKARRITLFLTKRLPRFKREAEVPLESLPPGAETSASPVIAAELELPDGKLVKVKLEIDTGDMDGLTLHTAFAKKYGLLAAGHGASLTQGAFGGTFKVARTSVPALFIGDQKIANPDTLCYEDAVGSSGNTEIDGEIGEEILSHFRVSIDVPEHFVVFEPQ